jgi:hypothetical protein
MLKLVLLFILVAISPLGPAARVSAANHPPAVNFDVNLQVSGPDVNFAAEIQGVANQSGDLQASLSSSDPDFPAIGIIKAGGVPYISVEGSPYRALTDNAGVPIGAFGHGAKRQPGELSAGCEATAEQLRGLLESPNGRQLLTSLAGIQDLGPAIVQGTTAEHYQGSTSFDSLLANPFVSAAVDQAIASCGGPMFAIDRSDLQSFLAGSSANLDAYLDADNLPRQFTLMLNLAALQLQFSLSGTLTPLAAPAQISAP